MSQEAVERMIKMASRYNQGNDAFALMDMRVSLQDTTSVAVRIFLQICITNPSGVRFVHVSTGVKASYITIYI